MSSELEAKFKVDTHDAIRAALASAGAQRVHRVLETNHILDAQDGSLRRAGAALRVRHRLNLDTNDEDVILTFKGPIEKSQFKKREERETSVDNADAILAILDGVGFVPILVFEKLRESWQFNDCTVELDEVPHFGHFVEIEGPTESAIETARRRLGLTAVEPHRETYVGMLMRYCSDNGIADRQVRFPESRRPLNETSPG